MLTVKIRGEVWKQYFDSLVKKYVNPNKKRPVSSLGDVNRWNWVSLLWTMEKDAPINELNGFSTIYGQWFLSEFIIFFKHRFEKIWKHLK